MRRLIYSIIKDNSRLVKTVKNFQTLKSDDEYRNIGLYHKKFERLINNDVALFLQIDASRNKYELLTGADLAEISIMMRNKGAHVFMVLDAALSSRANLLTRQNWRGADWEWSLRPEFKSPPPRKLSLQPSAGSFTAFYAVSSLESTTELKLPRSSPDGRWHGLFTYAFVSGLSSDLPATARNISKAVESTFVAHRRYRPRPRFESTDPDLPLVVEHLTGIGNSERIIIGQPTPKRGVSAIERGEIEIVARVETQERLLSAAIDSVLVDVSPDKRFEGKVKLSSGLNRIPILVFTESGKSYQKVLEYTYRGGKQSLIGTGTRFALIIANQNYLPDSGFHSLKTPIADVNAIADILSTRYGYVHEIDIGNGASHPLLLTDPTGLEIQSALHELGKVAGASDTVLIYYAGHGVYEEETTSAHWVPSDGRAGFEPSFLSASDISNAVKRLHAGNVLLVSDSCYSGALFRGGGKDQKKIEEIDRLNVLLKMQSRRTRRLMSSGNNEPVEDLGGDGHSIFARAFINGLQNMEHGAFTASELFNEFIRVPVGANADQEPQFRELKYVGHEGGDFVFVQTE